MTATGPVEPIAGLVGHVARTVEPEDCVSRGGHEVLSTPVVVRLLEEAAMAALDPVLRSDQGSVGSTVDIAHVKPTLSGQSVTATATVVDVDRRRIGFTVAVSDDVELVAHGRHERFVVDDGPFGARLADKIRRAGLPTGSEGGAT